MNSLGTARGSIELDFGGMRNSVKSAIAELNKIEATAKKNDAELKLLQSTSEKTGSALEKAGQKVKLLANKLDAAKQKASVYEREMQTLTSRLEDNKKAQEEVSGKLADTKNKYAEAEQNVRKMSTALADSKSALATVREQYGKNSEEVKVAKQAVAEHTEALKAAKETQKDYAQQVSALQSDQNRLQREFADGTDALEKWDTALISAQADVTNLQAELNNADGEVQAIAQAMAEEEEAARLAAEEMERMANATKSAGEVLSDAGDKIQNIGSKLDSIGDTMSKTVTAPLVAAGTAATKYADEYEGSAAKLQTLVEDGTISMEDMQARVRKVSDETGISANDANDAMYQYVSATQDVDGATDGFVISAKSAVGGFTDVTTAIDGLTTIMNAYHLKGTDNMSDIADKMLMTQNKGKTTFGELSQYLGQVVSTAYSANMSLDELLGSTATLTANGIQTSAAITGIKAALSNIISPTDDAKAAAEALGIQWDAAALQEKGWVGLLEDVRNSMKESAPEYLELTEQAQEYSKQLEKLTQTQEANTSTIDNLTTENDRLKKQMKSVKETSGSSSDEYKALSEQYDANVDKIKALKKENKELASSQKDLEKKSAGVTSQMDILANAADSPISVYAKLLGSVEGLNTVLTLTSDEGFATLKEYTGAIHNAKGAVDKAYDKMTGTNSAKVRKSLNRIKNTAIEAGEKILPVISDVLEKLADGVTKFSELDDSTQETILKFAAFTAAVGPALKVTGKFTSGLGGIVSKAGSVVSTLSGVTTATGEVAEVAEGAVTAFGAGSTGLTGVLGTLASPVGVAVGAATAVAAIGVAVEVAHQKAVKNNLAEHFGTVKLTADEARDAAERLTASDWTARLDLYTDAKEELDSVKEQLDTTVADINKTQWKIKMGIELTDEEKEQYKGDLENACKEYQSYLDNNQLTATLAVNSLFGKDNKAATDATNLVNSAYGSLTAEMADLTKQLTDLVNKDFEDGILDDKTVQKSIQKILKRMAEIKQEVADAEATVRQEEIISNFDSDNLDASSYKKFTKELNDVNKKHVEDANEAKITYMQSAEVDYREKMRKASEETNRTVRAELEKEAKETRDKAMQDAKLAYSDNVAESTINTLNDSLKPLQEAYPDIAGKNGKKFTKELVDGFNKNIGMLNSGELDFEGFLNSMDITSMSGYSKLTETDKDAIKEMLKQLEPTKEQLENLRDEYIKAGKTVPESVTEGLNQIDLLEAMVGSTDSYYSLLADQVANSPELQNAITAAYSAGDSVQQELVNALQEKYPEIYEATIGIFDTMVSGEQLTGEQVKSSFSALGISATDAVIKAVTDATPNVQQTIFSMLKQMESGTKLEIPQLMELFSALGIDLPETLITAISEREPDMQQEAINLIMQASVATGKKRDELLQQLADLGYDVDKSYADGISNNTKQAENAGKRLGDATAKGVQSTAKGSAESWYTTFWETLKKAGGGALKIAGGMVGLSVLNTIAPFANGGIVTEPTLSIMGENSDPEAIIPLSVSKRDRARALYDYVGSEIGANYSVQNNSNGLDTATLAKAIAAELATTLKNAPINNNVTVQMESGDVLLDRERVGRAVAPTVSRVLATR